MRCGYICELFWMGPGIYRFVRLARAARRLLAFFSFGTIFSWILNSHRPHINVLQGTTKRIWPGLVNMR